MLPAWVDSVHHTLIVRTILDNGGLPATLQPYLPAEFSYHYGFHVLAALFSGLTGTEPAVTLLWFGQLLNALIALSVFRLALELWGDWRRAILAALLVGFGLHMPAYYLTWGRYTLITGLLLLPLAMAALLRISRQPRDGSSILTAILLTAGTALSHYTALLLLGFFTLILVIIHLLQSPVDENGQRLPRWPSAGRPALAAGIGVLLASPWLLRTWQHLGSQATLGLVSPFDSGQAGYFDYILYLLGPIHNAVWLGYCRAGAGLGTAAKTSFCIGHLGIIAGLAHPAMGIAPGSLASGSHGDCACSCPPRFWQLTWCSAWLSGLAEFTGAGQSASLKH